MKKKLLIITAILAISLFVIYNVGFQIGNVSIGKQYDEIETAQKNDFADSPFSKEYLRQGQITVINLWASWCKPCVEEMPTFVKLQKDFPGVKFVMLSIDRKERDLKKGIEKFHIPNDITLQNSAYRKAIRNFLEGRDANSLIKTEVVPVTYIIKDGKVIFREEGVIDETSFSKKLSILNVKAE